MWISNTAATAMMLPIVDAICKVLDETETREEESQALMMAEDGKAVEDGKATEDGKTIEEANTKKSDEVRENV